MAVTTTKSPARSSRSHSSTSSTARRAHPSDDEILGIITSVPRPASGAFDDDSAPSAMSAVSSPNSASPSAATKPPVAPASAGASSAVPVPIPPALAQLFDAHPELRQTWDSDAAYRAIFATPAAAADARQQLTELDSLFFSSKPADHAALAARIHELSPEAFHALARAMHAHSAAIHSQSSSSSSSPSPSQSSDASQNPAAPISAVSPSNAATPSVAPASAAAPSTASAPQSQPASMAAASADSGPFGVGRSASRIPAQPELDAAFSSSNAAGTPPSSTASPAPPVAPASAGASSSASPATAAPAADPRQSARVAFLHSTNAIAVKQILGAIESQVDHLLPSSASAATRTRLVGEIYRDLDAALRSNQQLGKQLRDAFSSGPADAAHQRAIVTLVTGRARQALPAVARRVFGEWTDSLVGASRERHSRHESASKRVDIAGAGSSDGVNRKRISPRDLNYRKLSDADILNL